MGNSTLIYEEKLRHSLEESHTHLKRVEDAFSELEKNYNFPLNSEQFASLLETVQYLAFADQIIYRFSKLQDTMGAKLFKSFLLYQGENVDKPFLDILNRLEKMDILNVDEWFELRDIRNEIAHDYGESTNVAISILNTIYNLRGELKQILTSCEKYIKF